MSMNPEELKNMLKEINRKIEIGISKVHKQAAKEITECWGVVMMGDKCCVVAQLLKDFFIEERIIFINFFLEEIPTTVIREIQKMTGSNQFPKIWIRGKYICSLTEDDLSDEDPSALGPKLIELLTLLLRD